MRSSETLAHDGRSFQALKVSLEMIANLIYLSRRIETHCAQQHDYLDRAAKIMAEIARHPRLGRVTRIWAYRVIGPLRLGKIMSGTETRFRIVPLSEVPTPMNCEEKARLLRQYDYATLAFSNAVQELRRKIGTSPKEEYTRLTQISNEARAQSEQTRLALEQHIAAHGC
jgi:hypothetical protein